jgi:hypothetical protein
MIPNWDKQCLDILVNNWDNKESLLGEVALKVLSENPAVFYNACKKLGYVRADITQILIRLCRERNISLAPEESDDIINNMKIGKIPGIKQLRYHTGIGLAESKGILDKLEVIMREREE